MMDKFDRIKRKLAIGIAELRVFVIELEKADPTLRERYQSRSRSHKTMLTLAREAQGKNRPN